MGNYSKYVHGTELIVNGHTAHQHDSTVSDDGDVDGDVVHLVYTVS